MATNVYDRPQQERRYHERRRNWNPPWASADGMRVSWGGIWGGVLVALGALVLLSALGIAVGISAADPGQTGAAAIGTGAGIWGALSLLISLFLGGWTATRIGAITDRTTGFFEGALVWVVSVLIIAYLAGSGVGMLASGMFSVMGGATEAIGGIAQQTQGGINVSGTVEEMAAQLRDPQTAQRISSLTGLPANQVSSTLEQTAQQVEANSDNPAQAAAAAQQGISQLMSQAAQSGALERQAEEVQPEAAAAAWITFAALVLSLLAAVIGAMVGRRRTVAEAAPAAA